MRKRYSKKELRARAKAYLEAEAANDPRCVHLLMHLVAVTKLPIEKCRENIVTLSKQ